MAIDYGTKRVGLAVTDPLQIVASPLTTVVESEALDFVKNYCATEDVETIVLGLPLNTSGENTHATAPTLKFGNKLRNVIKGINLEFEDETFTSKLAVKAMIRGGMKKKDRRKKENIDKVSAAIILQSFLDNNISY